MVLEFYKHFVRKILSGTKIHSIRRDIHGRWKPGRTIHMATGVRTESYEQFAERVCIFTQEIEITNSPDRSCVTVMIDGKVFGVWTKGKQEKSVMIEKLAINDGFEDAEDFFRWFKNDYKGKIIHWTDFRY